MQDMDAVFRALSDPARRRLLDRMNQRNGLTVTELSEGMGMTRQSVSKHLDILETAELVTTLRRGREKLHFLNAAPINDIADRWISSYDRARAKALSDLKTALEATTPMGPANDPTTFVYSTYIQATPERVWRGLTDPEFTRRYWRHPTAGGLSMASDWQKGSTYDLTYDEASLVDRGRCTGGPRVRSLPPVGLHLAHLLSGVGRLARLRRGDRRLLARRARARRWPSTSRRPAPGVVKLTVVHDGFGQGSEVLKGISSGWPAVLASLKTLLETGSPLP